jgi:hypothetical protein
MLKPEGAVSLLRRQIPYEEFTVRVRHPADINERDRHRFCGADGLNGFPFVDRKAGAQRLVPTLYFVEALL